MNVLSKFCGVLADVSMNGNPYFCPSARPSEPDQMTRWLVRLSTRTVSANFSVFSIVTLVAHNHGRNLFSLLVGHTCLICDTSASKLALHVTEYTNIAPSPSRMAPVSCAFGPSKCLWSTEGGSVLVDRAYFRHQSNLR